jgi:AcrR family transcriptional regulator
VDGLRARKKLQSRQALSDAATALFAERGFDAVTVADIATAANVAVGTVFNYYRTKEELFFDRIETLEREMVDAVAHRPASSGVVPAFRGWHEDELAFLLNPRALSATRRFFATIAASPALQAAEPRLHQRLEHALAETIRRDGYDPADPRPELLAGVLMALHRCALSIVRTLALSGSDTADIRDHVTRATDQGFAMLTRDAQRVGRSTPGRRPDLT